MCWEHNCTAIVNLTRCVEKGREKCCKYWPDTTEPLKYWNVEVTMLNESRVAEWTVRLLQMHHLDKHTSRTILHMHYTAWPDFGVPERPSSLVQLVRAFRERVPVSTTQPTVVHCSAGVGRSGTFIAIERILQSLAQQPAADVIDVFGIVHEMRQHRVCMVQSEVGVVDTGTR